MLTRSQPYQPTARLPSSTHVAAPLADRMCPAAEARGIADSGRPRPSLEPALQAGAATPVVEISPPDAVTRRIGAQSPGLAAEIVQATSHVRIELRFRAPMHMLVLCEQGARYEGETFVEGLPRSSLREFTRKLTFVPAGHQFQEWQLPRTLTHLMFFYFDPAQLPALRDAGKGEVMFNPRLFFEDRTLWDTALKLKRLVETPALDDRLYFEALSAVLVHELARLDRGGRSTEPQIRGGLAAWQQRIVKAYIEEHVTEPISLRTLAELVRLSPQYFCRAFKQSFGLPPNRYHNSRRMERAKAMLAKSPCSVTQIGLTLGFSETSSFSTAFRKATGMTPSAYHRTLG